VGRLIVDYLVRGVCHRLGEPRGKMGGSGDFYYLIGWGPSAGKNKGGRRRLSLCRPSAPHKCRPATEGPVFGEGSTSETPSENLPNISDCSTQGGYICIWSGPSPPPPADVGERGKAIFPTGSPHRAEN
jgi:hypothetical protein